jgi:uncharacterized protein YqeY
MPAQPASASVRERLRAALPPALKARDAVAVAALRSALAAIDNAEAVEGAPAPRPAAGDARIAGTVGGLGAAEVERRSLTGAQMDAIVRAEVAEREAAARAYERAGRHERAERLRAEAGVLSALLA